MSAFKDMKVAIVHDWLLGGGGERVVEELHKMFPDAPIYTSYSTKEWRNRLDGKVKTGVLQYWPFSKLRKFLPLLRIWWFPRLNLEGYDLVISSSGAEAKAITVPESTLHVNYCHAPTHYYWSRYDAYMEHPGFGPLDPLARHGLRILASPLRKWDYKAAQKPHYMIANSTHTKNDIKNYYNRKSDVVFPPVQVERFALEKPLPRYGFVIAGRQTPYKRFDLAIEACNLARVPLKVIGKGPDHERLIQMAGPTIRFLTNVSDKELLYHFQSANAFLFPGIDDFGIVAVEALASGTPVIAYKKGGALDYVTPGITGEFFEEQTAESLAEVLAAFDPTTYNNQKIIRSSHKFNAFHFRENIVKQLTRYVQKRQNKNRNSKPKSTD